MLRSATEDYGWQPAGRALAGAEIQRRSSLFAEHLLRWVPLAAYIRRVPEDRSTHQASRSRFLEELEDHLGVRDAEPLGRYAELFFYDHAQRVFSLVKSWERVT